MLAWVVLSMGCIPAMPPPAHYVPLQPVSTLAVGTPTAEIGAALGFPPQLSASYASAFRGAGALVGDVALQPGATSFLGTTGITLRTRPRHSQGLHLGLRLAGIAGTGDMFGVSHYKMPFVGGEGTIQLGLGMKNPMGAWVVNFGAQGMLPLTEQEYDYVDGSGAEILARPIPGIFGTIETRFDLPLSHSAALMFGAGLDVAWILTPFPRAAFGVRWSPGAHPDRAEPEPEPEEPEEDLEDEPEDEPEGEPDTGAEPEPEPAEGEP